MAESSHIFNDNPRWADLLVKSEELIPDTASDGGAAVVTGFPLSPALEDVNSSKVLPSSFVAFGGAAIRLPTRRVPPPAFG